MIVGSLAKVRVPLIQAEMLGPFLDHDDIAARIKTEMDEHIGLLHLTYVMDYA
jgi:hypothetical protein